MPVAFLLIVGLLYYGSASNENTKIQENKPKEITAANTSQDKNLTEEIKTSPPKKNIIKEENKVEPKQLEAIKEEIKVEPKKLEVIKEEIKVKPKQLEVIKEEIKVKPKQLEVIKEEIKVEPKEAEQTKEAINTIAPKKNYLKIVLYIIGGILAIFTGMYFFSNRKKEHTAYNPVDNSRTDIEENIEPKTQEQQPVEEEVKPETTEQESTNEDENNNK